MKTEVEEKIITLIEEIDVRLSKIRKHLGHEDGKEKPNVHIERMKILAEVLDNGGVVSREKWKEIGKKYGKDVRGLGGFYVGEKASMVRIGDEKRALTEIGTKAARAWKDNES